MEKTQHSEKLLLRKLDLLLRTGKLLMESAADTSRIMRNMKRTAAYLGLPDEHLHIYINYNMLMVNLSDSEHSFSKFQRCEKHGINMTAISAVNFHGGRSGKTIRWKDTRKSWKTSGAGNAITPLGK